MAAGFSDDKYDVYRPQIWSPRINRFLKEKLYAARVFQDRSDEIEGTDDLYIPHISDTFSGSASIPVTSGNVIATDISETKTALTIDKWYGNAFYITKFEEREIMKRPNLIDEYSQAMGYKLARTLERDLLSNFKSFTPTAGTTDTSLVATNVESALGILNSNSVSMDECVFFFNPKIYTRDILSIQKYYDASQFGKATVPHGFHDMLYGIPVLLTPNTFTSSTDDSEAVHNGIAHPSSIVFGRTGVDFSVKDSEHLRKKIIADIIYGHKLLNAKRGVQLLAVS